MGMPFLPGLDLARPLRAAVAALLRLSSSAR